MLKIKYICLVFILITSGLSETTLAGRGKQTHDSHSGSPFVPFDELDDQDENAEQLSPEEMDNASKGNSDDRARCIAEKQNKYCTGTISFSKLAKTIAKESVVTLCTAGMTALGSYYALSYFQNAMSTDASAGQAIALTTTLSTAVSSTVSGSVQNIIKAFKECRMSPLEGLRIVHHELKNESADLVKTLPPDIQNKIEGIDSKIDQVYAGGNNGGYENVLKYLRRRQEVYLALPTKPKNVAQYDRNGSDEEAQQIDKRVENLLAQYPENRDALAILIQQIRDNSIVTNPSRVQAYLYGPPGTGKTTFVKNLGKALGLYVCEIRVSDLNADELTGPEHLDDYFNSEDSKALGKLGDCFRKAGHNNPLLFLDEAGEYVGDQPKAAAMDVNTYKKQLIQGQFKKLLDQSNANLKLTGVGVTFNTSRSSIFMAGNIQLRNSALLGRSPQFYFKQLGMPEKIKAAQEAFNKSIATLKEFLKDSDVNDIKNAAEPYLDFILDEDTKRNPGGRIVKDVIHEFVNHMRIVMNTKQVTRESDKTPDEEKKDLESFIIDSLNRRQVISEDLPSMIPSEN